MQITLTLSDWSDESITAFANTVATDIESMLHDHSMTSEWHEARSQLLMTLCNELQSRGLDHTALVKCPINL